jgi:hypothetical protein
MSQSLAYSVYRQIVDLLHTLLLVLDFVRLVQAKLYFQTGFLLLSREVVDVLFGKNTFLHLFLLRSDFLHYLRNWIANPVLWIYFLCRNVFNDLDEMISTLVVL